MRPSAADEARRLAGRNQADLAARFAENDRVRADLVAGFRARLDALEAQVAELVAAVKIKPKGT